MGIPQRVSGLTVIERPCRPILPSRLNMTLVACAGAPCGNEPAAMRVLMTVDAPLELLDDETRCTGLPATVATFTGDRCMLSLQREAGRGMVEMRCDSRPPPCRGMAAFARLLELPSVRI